MCFLLRRAGRGTRVFTHSSHFSASVWWELEGKFPNSLGVVCFYILNAAWVMTKDSCLFLSFTFQSRVLLELWWPLGALSWLCWPIPVTFCCCDKKPWPETIQGRDCFDLQFQRARWPEWQVEHERKSRMLRNHPSTVQRKWGEGYLKKPLYPQ